MIIRTLSVEGFGCFADKATVGPLGNGVNILFGPNGVGKSTLSRAITSVLLDGHRVKAAEMKTIRPWGRKLPPQVMLEFENAGRGYRVRKQFLDTPSSSLYRQEGGTWKSLMTNDDTDDFLRTLLHCTPPGSGVVQPKHWGLAQILWTTQGELTIPPLASGIVESIQRSVGAQLTAGGSAVERKILERYGEFYQPKLANLKRSAPARTLADERARLAQDVATARELLAQWESEAIRVEELRSQLAIAQADREHCTALLNAARGAAQTYTRLMADKAERLQRKRAAESEYAQISGQIDRIQRWREQIRLSAAESVNLAIAAPDVEAEFVAASAAAAAAEQQFQRAQAEECDVEVELRTAKMAAEYVQALEFAAELDKKIRSIIDVSAEVERLGAAGRGILAPSDAELRLLRLTADAECDAQRRLELARVNVVIEPLGSTEITVLEGESVGCLAVTNGSILEIGGAPNLAFVVPGFGMLRVTGPASDYASLREQREKCLAELQQFAVRFGTSDAQQLQSLRREAEKIENALSKAQAIQTALLAGRMFEMLQADSAEVQARIESIAARFPEWRATPPNAEALGSAATRRNEETRHAFSDAYAALLAGQQRLQKAAAARDILQVRAGTLKGAIQDATGELSLCCGDQTDDDRKRLQHKAAMEHDACTGALLEVEKQLAAYPEDPADQLGNLERGSVAADAQVQTGRDALLRSETRVSEMTGKALYSEYGVLSESLAVVENEATREQLKMDALALLHNTLLQVKEELLTAVSKPVEERATSYLEHVCGKPFASIQLTNDFAVEKAIPVELADSPENSVGIERMSGGEKEQIWLCTRAALAMELIRLERQFLLLDDILISTDAGRMSRICDVLAELAEHMQVIVFTCHPERFADISAAHWVDIGALSRSQAGVADVAA